MMSHHFLTDLTRLSERFSRISVMAARAEEKANAVVLSVIEDIVFVFGQRNHCRSPVRLMIRL
jgi:hypothetical protein